MANAEAWAEGAAIGSERAKEHRAHKQALSDQQFQDKHDEIQGMIDNLGTKLAAVPEDARNTPDYLKMQDQLAQAIQDRNAHWKSVDQPNALSKFGKMLGKDLRFKKQEAPVPVAPPVYGQPTIQTPASQGESVTLSGEPAQPASDRVDMVDGHLKATRDPGSPALPASTVSLGGSEAGPSIPAGPAYKVQGPQTPAQMKAAAEATRMIAAAPLSPEQQGTLGGQKQAAMDLAVFNGKMKIYYQQNPHAAGPDATPEEKQAAQDYANLLLQGNPAKTQNYKPDVQSLTLSDGTTISGQWTPVPSLPMKGKWQNLDGTDIEPSLLAGAKITPKPGKTGYQYLAGTWQVKDLATGKLYNVSDIGKPDTPKDVVDTFNGAQASMDEKQKKALALANARGASFAQNRIVTPIDPDNPTKEIYVAAGEAAKKHMNAPGSIDYKLALPTASERQRADFAISAHDQLKDMGEILTSRPDLFGPLSGRYTDFTQWVGSQDPDAQKFRVAARVLSDHAMAVFGARSQYASESIFNLVGQNATNPAAGAAGLAQLDKALEVIGGRGSGPIAPGSGAAALGTGGAGGNTTPKSKGRRSIKGAMMLPENKGKTEAEVTKHLTDLGYTPVKP